MARRQEQESAKEEISEVAPNVLRMQLPISMPGLGHVNCYALVDGEGAALVDPGLPGPISYKALQSRLASAGLAVRNVHTVIVTHSHPDHFGGASRLAKDSGAKVVAHTNFFFGLPQQGEPEVSVEDLEAQRERLDDEDEPDNGPNAPHFQPAHSHAHPHAPHAGAAAHRPWGRGGRTPWGGQRPRPPWRTRLKWSVMRRLKNMSLVPEVTDHVGHRATLRLAGREYFIVHTPGHTEDHICLHSQEEGVFLSGDHVLPTITPHISGIARSHDPLHTFVQSLDMVAATPDVKQVLPAHGHPFEDLAGRCEAIKVHHDERLEKVKSIGRELGPATVQAFSHKLFKPRSWGAMAESETYAHLEHLRIAGDAGMHEDADGMLVYEI